MNPFPSLFCIRCRGMAYLEDDTIACMTCGRTLGIQRLVPRGPLVKVSQAVARDPQQHHAPELRAICEGWLVDGETAHDVAYAADIRENTVKRWRTLLRLGQKRRPPHAPELRAICESWLVDGETARDVAYAADIPKNTIKTWRTRLGLGKKRAKRTWIDPDLKAEALSRMLAGDRVTTISVETGIKTDTLHKWRVRADDVDAVEQRNVRSHQLRTF